MCVVSMVGDFYRNKHPTIPDIPQIPPNGWTITYPTGPSREEFEALKKDVLDMKELLKRAIDYDEDNNQKGCEIDEKIDHLRKLAAVVGISLEDVLERLKK